MSSYQHSDFGVSNQSTDDDDHFTVTLAPYNHSSNVSLKLPDSDSGLQGSSKATGSLKNSLSSTDGEDLQDGDEESSRGAFSYFPSGESRKLVTVSSNTHNFDECIEVDSDKSSIESPRSDGSSTQEYEVTQPDECELQDMSSRSEKDYIFDDAADNVHKELYGPPRLPHFFSRSHNKMERGSACVDAPVEFNLSKSKEAARYSRYGSDGYHQPPFGEGTNVLTKVGHSLSGLISSHPGAVENMPAGEEIKQNGGLDSDGRKRRKKKKPSAGHLGGQDDANTHPVLSLGGSVDINGNPHHKGIRETWRESGVTESLASSKPKSYGATKETGKDPSKESSKDSSKPESASSGSNPDQSAVSGSDGKPIKRKKQKKEPVVLAEHVPHYIGRDSIESILNYVNGHSSGKKSGKKATSAAAAPVGKVTERSEGVKKGKAIHSPNDFGDEDSPVSVGVGNMGNSANKSSSNKESSVMSKQAGEVVEVSEEARSLVRQIEQVAVEEVSDLQKNKNKNSTKQANDKHGENNNVKKPGNKSEGASKPNKKVEKEGPSAGVNKKTRTEAEPSKEEEFSVVTSPATEELSSNQAYIFTDLDSLHQPKMEADFLPVTNKKRRQRSLVKEPVQPYQNNYHPKDHKFHFSPRTASPPLTEGGMGDKSNSYDFSPAGFPGLPKKGGASQKSGFQHVRRNSIGEVPVDPSKQLQDDSDIESVKSLPVGQLHQGGWMESQRPLSYAKITASKPEGSGSTTEGARGAQKPTVWKGSLTERRHSIGSKPEKLKQDSDSSGDLRSRHKSGSQEVLKTDDKECSTVSRNQTEPAMATADGLRDSGLLAPNSEMDFPCLPVSSASLVKPSEAKPQPPVSHVQSSQHSSGQNSEGAPPHTSAATAPPQVKATNSVAVARSPNAPVVSSASDTTSAGARSQTRSGEAADAAQDHKRSKATVARVPNNGRKPQPVFFCDRKCGNEPENLDITFGYDSSIDDVRPAPKVLPQQSLNSSQGVSFGLEQGDGPDAPIFTATSPNLGTPSPPPPPHSQPSRGVSDGSKSKLGRMNGVVSSACKHLEPSVSMARVPPPPAPLHAALGMGRGMPGVGQVIPGVPPMIPGFPPHLIPTMPHMMPLMGQTIPGMVGQPMLHSVGQNLPGMLPGAAAVGMGGHVIPTTGAQAAHGHVMGHVVGHKGQGTLRRVEYGALAEPAGGTRKFIVYYEIPESKGNFNLEEAAAYLQQMYDKDVMAQKQDGSMGMNRQDN